LRAGRDLALRDRGSVYATKEFRELVTDLGMRSSMGRVGARDKQVAAAKQYLGVG
jgi:transposase InsO family protein